MQYILINYRVIDLFKFYIATQALQEKIYHGNDK